MGSLFGGPAGQTGGGQRFPTWALPAIATTFGGQPVDKDAFGRPVQTGLFYDVGQGAAAATPQQLYGGIPQYLQAGQIGAQGIQNLAMQGTLPNFQNLQNLAYGGMGNVGAVQNFANLAPQAGAASSQYLQQLNQMLQGGPGVARVTNAALGAAENVGIDSDLYRRAADLLRPEVRAAFSSRGLGASGNAVREESNQLQQLADQFAIRAAEDRARLLGVAASAAGPEASQYGAQLQAATVLPQLPGQILQQLQGVAGAPLDAATVAAALQGQPVALASVGANLYQMGLQMGIEPQRLVYEFTRDPQKTLLSVLAGTRLSQGTDTDYRGLGGIPKNT